MTAGRQKPRYRYAESASQKIPTRAHCRACGADVLTGRYDALPIICDPQHLSARGELVALLLRLRTWHIVEPHVYKRHRIALTEERTPKIGHILREHRCGTPAPTGDELAPPPPAYDRPGF